MEVEDSKTGTNWWDPVRGWNSDSERRLWLGGAAAAAAAAARTLLPLHAEDQGRRVTRASRVVRPKWKTGVLRGPHVWSPKQSRPSIRVDSVLHKNPPCG
ncbi:hypothetical protein NL676_028480 [Syzygium grande]|nr:hypothetical protein NL676_028480 [Syzygium grande]